VNHNYRIATTEVTNAQYAEFLNAKAASDPLQLWNSNMGSTSSRGGISRSLSNGSFTYAARPDMGNKPVNWVSWYDALRFINWLHNGQGSGDTETGAYTLLGGTPTPTNGSTVTRNAGATVFMPTEDEWYKAAYHQPAAQGGDSDNYWQYPTATNTPPTVATANSVGDISNPGANVANYNDGADWGFNNGHVTTVGSAGPLSRSYYGTSDQGGNLWEWTETKFLTTSRIIRGGAFFTLLLGLDSSFDADFLAANPGDGIGFRVAMVPEPGTAGLAVMALALLVCWRLRR
jgi:formylglycine-generating enzyme required for sulfatase activity